MKRLYIAMCLGVAALLALAYWKNAKSYSWKPASWRIVKSTADTTLVIVTAMCAPALLIGWTTLWLTRGVKRRGIQVTLAIVFGILFGSISGIALEVLCVLGIFSVDLLTGSQGLYGWWNKPIPDDFLPLLREDYHGRFSRDSASAA